MANALEEKPELAVPDFVKYLIQNRGLAAHKSFKEFLQEHLDSHARIVVKKQFNEEGKAMNELMENFEAFGKNYLNRLTELLGEMDLTQIDLLMVVQSGPLEGNTIFSPETVEARHCVHYACDFLGANVMRKLDPFYRAH